jgi:hypothetical protein
MSKKSPSPQLTLTYDTTELSPAQIRLIRRVHSTLADLLTTDEEGEYFEGSAELMRVCAELIRLSHFSDSKVKTETIPYGEQAVEYSMECLQDQIERGPVGLDN